MSSRRYESLDALAEDFRPGDTVIFRMGGERKRAGILGYVYSLPLEPGGRREPALVIGPGGGHVYPCEIERVVGFRNGRHFDKKFTEQEEQNAQR